MKYFRAIVFLIFSICIFNSCNNCSDVACFTPPNEFLFEINAESLDGEFVIQPENVRIVSKSTNNVHMLSSNDFNERLIFTNTEIGWETDNSEYELQIIDLDTIDFRYESIEKNEDCCTFFELVDISSKDVVITEETIEFEAISLSISFFVFKI